MKFIEKWKFKLFGRGVQTFAVEEYDAAGKVLILRDVGKTKRRANSIVETWDSKGNEITAPAVQLIRNDTNEPAYITADGETVNLYIWPSIYPNREQVIGFASNFDDIVDSTDMGKSGKNIMYGIIIGILFWASIGGPMVGAFLS